MSPSDGPPAPAGPGTRARVLFDAVLYPHCSLPRRGFWLIMAVVAAVSLTVGGMFFVRGAWPIFGFYGLDIALVYFALRANYRAARRYEKVRLTETELVVERGTHRGVTDVIRLQPHWLRVLMDDPPEHESQVRLTAHGRSVIVGAFLSPAERLDFARALQRALEALRRPVPTPDPA
ncbi:MAG: DUF2244 domain-containing protein [Azospirillaceae bacterium]